MLRDNRLDAEYFDRYIERKQRSLSEREKDISSGALDLNEYIAFTFLYLDYKYLAFAKYSRGDDPGELVPIAGRLVELSPYTSCSDYRSILDVLCLAVLLELGKPQFDVLAEVYRKHGIVDCLSNFLLHYRIGAVAWKGCRSHTVGRLQRHRKTIEAPTAAEQESLMREYLSVWRSTMTQSESHKYPERFAYCGYWSMEAGAVSKVLKLDDKLFRDSPYYPYDLVHYKHPRRKLRALTDIFRRNANGT